MGLEGNPPGFYEQLNERLTFPGTAGQIKPWNEGWKQQAGEWIKDVSPLLAVKLLLRDSTPFRQGD